MGASECVMHESSNASTTAQTSETSVLSTMRHEGVSQFSRNKKLLMPTERSKNNLQTDKLARLSDCNTLSHLLIRPWNEGRKNEVMSFDAGTIEKTNTYPGTGFVYPVPGSLVVLIHVMC